MTQADLRKIESDLRADPFPGNLHLRGNRVPFPAEAEIAYRLGAREQSVEMLLDELQVEHQMEPIPTSQRRRERQSGHQRTV